MLRLRRYLLRAHACPPYDCLIRHLPGLLLLLITFASAGTAGAAISIVDDNGSEVRLAGRATRIISLAPHVTELLFAAGAGQAIVGAIEYSDYPEAARKIPRIGNHATLQTEHIVALQPDLVIAWLQGNSQKQLRPLLGLGIPVYYNQPNSLEDIARSIQHFGILAGTEKQADAVARDFRARVAVLRARMTGRAPVSVFYQISSKPYMTLHGRHLSGDLLRLCGAKALFADMPMVAPTVSLESIVAADPEAIISTSAKREGLDEWAKWPQLRAVRNGHLIALDGNLLNRQGPRIIEGAEQLCAALEKVRNSRAPSGRTN